MLVNILPLRLRSRAKEHRTLIALVNIIVLFAVVCVAFTVGFKYAEGVSWQEAIWQVWQTATTVGYGNGPATTLWGQIVTMVLGLLGIAILGSLITAIVEYRQEKKAKRRLGFMENPQANGLVIVHYPGDSHFLTLYREFRHKFSELGICIIDSVLDELPSNIAGLPGVHFVRGGLIDHDTYMRAVIPESRWVWVFPENPTVAESDAKTATIVRLVEKIVPPTTKIQHILVEPKNALLFEGLRSQAIWGSIEVLVGVQELEDPHTSELINRLMRNTEGADPDTLEVGLLVGWTWGELVRACVVVSDETSVPMNLFAIISVDGGYHLCPSANHVIRAGDLLSIIKHEGFDWPVFQRELEAYREREKVAVSSR